MIGQAEVIQTIQKSSARAILLTGFAHWGKKTLIRELLSKEETVFELSGNSNDFRNSIYQIYTTVRPCSYIIPDLDTKHPTVQNLLLKVIEEPPMSSKFYITASSSVLPTINSRCVSFCMKPYTKEELVRFGKQQNLDSFLFNICKSPGQAMLLKNFDIKDVISQLTTLANEMKANTKTLANYLKIFKPINKTLIDLGIKQDAFILIAMYVFGDKSRAVEWLRQQPDDSVRYVRTQFIMKYWLEQQEMT